MNNNNKITHKQEEEEEEEENQSTYISYSIFKNAIEEAITLKCIHIVCHHVGQIYSPVETSSDQEQYYIMSAWHL